MDSVKARCVAVALAMQLLGATAARATDQEVQPPGAPGLDGAVAGNGSGPPSDIPAFGQVDRMSFGNLGPDRQAESFRNHEDLGEQDHGLEAGSSDRLERDDGAQRRAANADQGIAGGRHGKPARGRRHRPLGAGARDRAAARGRSPDRQGHGGSTQFIIISVAPGTYGFKANTDGASSYGGHTYGGISGNSGFAASLFGPSGGGSSPSSGGAPSPEVDTVVGFVIVAVTVAYIRRRRGDEANPADG